MKKIVSIHFVGIKGVGMTSLAVIANEAGIHVTGSDVEDKFITDSILHKNGIIPFVGFDKTQIGNADLVITTGAHGGFDNIEVRTAIERKIPVWSQGEAVGEFMKGTLFGRSFKGISISGTHGKTTTSAMIATVLKENNVDPSYIIGTASVPSLGFAGHLGKGKWFIAEADEYVNEPIHDRQPKFLMQNPEIAVVTNIEFDHPDVYANLDEVYQAFLQFTKKLPKEGLLVACGDDERVKALISIHQGRKLTYGFSEFNDVRITRDTISDEQIVSLTIGGKQLGQFHISIPGSHNALNATAAILVAREVGLTIEQIDTGLQHFKNAKRRMEFVGTIASGALVYDDYAHHPTEIEKTLSAFKEQFPYKKLVCIFQPHTYSRTKTLFNDFTKVFGSVDEIILTDIYASQRETKDTTVSSHKLAEAIKSKQQGILYLPTLDDVVEYLHKRRFNSSFVILTMGAGDVYRIGERVVMKHENS